MSHHDEQINHGRRMLVKGAGALCLGAAFPQVAMAASTRTLNAVERRPNTSALAIEAETGRVLYEHNADAPRIPASEVKPFGDMVMFDDIRENPEILHEEMDVTRAIRRMVDAEEDEGHRFLAHYGVYNLSVEEALKFKILRSMNGPSLLLANKFGGSEAAFVERMQAKAQAIGCDQTVIRNSTGYHHEEQVTSPRDLVKMAQHLITHYNRPGEYERYGRKVEKIRKLNVGSFNRFLHLDEADGIKTGRLNICGAHNLGSAVRDGKRVITLVMGAADAPEAALANRQLARLAFERHSVEYPGIEPVKKTPSSAPERKVKPALDPCLLDECLIAQN